MQNETVVNLSEVELLVIETTTNHGKSGRPPAVVHKLKPGYRSPSGTDTDGFKRADGQPIDGHSSWIKLRDPFTARITGSADALKVDLWFGSFVKEDEFGSYELDSNPQWGELLHLVTHVIKEKKRTVGYMLNGSNKVDRDEAIALYSRGLLVNVTLVHRHSGSFLRTLPDRSTSNNLSVVS